MQKIVQKFLTRMLAMNCLGKKRLTKRSVGGSSIRPRILLVSIFAITVGLVSDVPSYANEPEIHATASDDGPPNVILVLIDALRRDSLGVYGYAKDTSPFMDSLLEEGVIFDNAYAQASETRRSTASLLTSSFYPVWVPVNEAERRDYYYEMLGGVNITLAEVLQRAGYETLGIFTNPHHHPKSGFMQGFDQHKYLESEKAYTEGSIVNEEFFRWAKARKDERPFFAYLHYMDVHNPYRPLPEFEEKFVTVRGRDRYRNGIPVGRQVPTDEDLRYMKALYDAEIRYVDTLLEQLWLWVKDHMANQETILVIASDHGDEFMEHGGLGHGQTLEKEMLYIPLIFCGISDPEVRRVQQLVRNIDIAPTILEILDIGAPNAWDGKSLVELVRPYSTDGVKHRVSYARTGSLRSVTNDIWHGIWDIKNNTRKLYNNRTDPRGLNNVVAANPSVMSSMQIQMITILEAALRNQASSLGNRDDFDQSTLAGDEEDFDFSQLEEQLRALGYVE